MGSPLVEEALLALARQRQKHHMVTSICSEVFHREEKPFTTLDGDLGIGGGPPGLRVWLDASLTLRKCTHAFRRCTARSRLSEKCGTKVLKEQMK